MVWNEDTIGHLRELWAEGHSTAEIGRRLGVSKNAIVGKAHRLELDGRPSPIRRDGPKPAAERPAAFPRVAGPTLPPLASAIIHPLTAPQVPARVAVAPTPAVPVSNVQALRPVPDLVVRAVAPPSAAPVRQSIAPTPMASRRSAPACCWPIGDPGTKAFRFCDDVSLPGKPYCDDHAKLAYVRIRDRKEDAA
jgi:GcrA cell cycle regulator